jgi:hypothetical protein
MLRLIFIYNKGRNMSLTSINNNFSGGLVNRGVAGLIDTNAYNNSVEICDNFVIGNTAGVKNRTGTLYNVPAYNGLIIPFILNDSNCYAILFTESYVYFLFPDINGNLQYVMNGDNKFTLPTPYYFADLKNIKYAQNGDKIILTHRNYKAKELTRLTETSFSLNDLIFYNQEEQQVNPFGDNNYPSCCCFYENRLFFAGLTSEPTYIYASDFGQYNYFTFDEETVDDLNAFKFDVNDAISNIDWLVSGDNSLVLGTSERVIAVNGGNNNSAITSTNIFAKAINNIGSNKTQPCHINNIYLYVDKTQRKTRIIGYDLLAQRYNTPTLNDFNYELTDSGILKIVRKRDNNSNFFVLKNNGELLSVCFRQGSENEINMNAWSKIKIATGNIIDIIVLPTATGEDNLYFLMNVENNYFFVKYCDEYMLKNIDDFLENTKEETKLIFNRYVNDNLKNFNYLDFSKTFSNRYNITLQTNTDGTELTTTSAFFTEEMEGRKILFIDEANYKNSFGEFLIIEYTSPYRVTTKRLTETSSSNTNVFYCSTNIVSINDDSIDFYNNKIVSVVADGEYVGEFRVMDGEIKLIAQYFNCIIGFKYKSLLKTHNIGFSLGSKNAQILKKNIDEIGLRLLNTQSGKIGTDYYNGMVNIDNNQDDIINYFNYDNNLINGDTLIKYRDLWNLEKNFYLLQDKPQKIEVLTLFLSINIGI